MEIILNNVSYLDQIINVSFEVEDNKILGVVGSSDSFKDVLFDIISGFSMPTSGKVMYGSDYRNFGLVHKYIDDQFFYDNVLEQFMFTLKTHGILNVQKRIEDSLKIVHLGRDILDRNFYDLSLSEKVKVKFALALSINPEVLILYEPLFGLDRNDSDNVLKIIRMMKLRYGKTIIIFSKDTDLIYKVCDDAVLFNDGEVVRFGDKNSIFVNEKLMKICKLNIPKNVEFSKIVKRKKKVDIGFKCDFDDLVKDIYRFVR